MGGDLDSTRAAALLCLLALGCFAQKPSSESAPSAAPEAPPPAAEVQAAPAASPPEEKREGTGLGEVAPDRAPGAGGAAPAPATTPLVPQKESTAKTRRRAQPEADGEGDDRALGTGPSRSDRLRQRLDRAYRAGAPNCPSARDRKKAVCDLAVQICQLIDRDPNVASVAEYCADAKERCAEAQRRIEERCGE